MTTIKENTKAGQAIINDYLRTMRNGKKTIYQAYGRPSSTKVESYNAIEKRAVETDGYQHDLSVCGAGSHFFSTIYSVIENGTKYIIKDTKCNVYKVAFTGV